MGTFLNSPITKLSPPEVRIIAKQFTSTWDKSYLSDDKGITWSELSMPDGGSPNGADVYEDMLMVATSAYSYYSMDAGANWYSLPNAIGHTVCFSGDGSMMYELNGLYLWVSSTSSISWTQVTLSGTDNAVGMCVSDDGQYVYIARGRYITYTDDYGANWKNTPNFNGNVGRPACSGDGQYVYIGTYYASGVYTNFYKSTNAGATWGSPQSIYSGNSICASIHCSNSGQYIMVGSTSPRAIYISNDYGSTWVRVFDATLELYNQGAHCVSYSGKYMVVGHAFGDTKKILYSEDFGVNWSTLTINTSNASWARVTSLYEFPVI